MISTPGTKLSTTISCPRCPPDRRYLALLRRECQPQRTIFSRAMPIYEYRCKKGHTFDTMQRFSDDAIDTCDAGESVVTGATLAATIGCPDAFAAASMFCV